MSSVVISIPIGCGARSTAKSHYTQNGYYFGKILFFGGAANLIADAGDVNADEHARIVLADPRAGGNLPPRLGRGLAGKSEVQRVANIETAGPAGFVGLME